MPPPVSGMDAKFYITAFKEAGSGRWSAAHRIAARARDPLGAKVLRWMDYARAHNPASFDEISTFIANNPDWPSQSGLEASAETAMLGVDDDTRIRDWFRWRDPVSRDGRLRFADVLIADGDVARAAIFIREAWVGNNFSGADLKIIFGRYKNYLRQEDHDARLDRLIWDNRQRDARRMFRYVDKRQRAVAEARMALHAFAGGVDGAIARVPEDLLASAGLMYERLRWRRRKGRDDGAEEILFAAPEELGRPKLWWRERAIQTRRALNSGRVSDAYRLASGHGQIESSTFAEAEWLAGWIALRFLGDNTAAYEHFTRLYEAVFMPISRARAAYWAGRAATAMGDPDGAALWYAQAAHYPGTYYGQLAAARIGGAKALLFANESRTGEEIANAVIADNEMFAVIRLLNFLGQDRLAGVFVSHLVEISKGPADHALIAGLAHALGRYDLAIRAAKQATRDGYISNARIFPLVDLPFAYANDELEHALVLALTRQESLFDREIASPAGARGLMQLMPATASQVSRGLRLPYAKNKLTQAAYNVKLGSTYLANMIDKHDGSYVLALAAYNAGPTNVRRWLRANGDPRQDSEVDLVDWIEMIPIPETRNYVQRVLEGVQAYRWQLGVEVDAASIERDLARGFSARVLASRCDPGDADAAIAVADLAAHC
ncbi:MAG: lytic transglycosylase domain-containing protein [Proteobacteria bacterium]|nr:lytic transglycosylase domain-containing protein [Pseudomonadota bacterium]